MLYAGSRRSGRGVCWEARGGEGTVRRQQAVRLRGAAEGRGRGGLRAVEAGGATCRFASEFRGAFSRELGAA